MDDDALDPTPGTPEMAPAAPAPPAPPVEPAASVAEEEDDAAAFGAGKVHVVGVVAVIAAAAPFVLSFSSSSSRTVNGVVVASSYFNPVAVIGGATAVAAALLLAFLLFRRRVRGRLNHAAAILALGVGAYHLLGGVGVFAPHATAGFDARPAIGGPVSPTVPTPPSRQWNCTRDPKTIADCHFGCEKANDGLACDILGLHVAGVTQDGAMPDWPKARALFERACELGSPDGCGDAGAVALDERAGPVDWQKARGYFQRACDLGETIRCLAIVEFTPEDGVLTDADATTLLDRACTADLASCTKAADIALKGGPSRRASQLLGWLCRHDNAVACNELGRLLDRDSPLHDGGEAGRLYDLACAGGSADGCVNAGIRRLRTDPPDIDAARPLFTKGCAGEAASGCFDFASDVSEPLIERELLLAACEGGSGRACTGAGVGFYGDEAAPADLARARALFTRGCDANDFWGCHNLGLTYVDGRIDPAAPETAEPILERACRVNDRPTACAAVATMLGERGRRDAALRLLHIGCDELSQAESCMKLPFLSGTDEDPDPAIMIPSTQKACDLGSALGCKNLAVVNENGAFGVVADPARAFALYSRGCELGSGSSCRIVGVVKTNGELGQPVDEAGAKAAFERGCELRDGPSCEQIGKGGEAPPNP